MPLPPVQSFVDYVGPPIGATWLNAVDAMLHGAVKAQGVNLPAFGAGYVQYIGSDGNLAANTNFIFGTALPNPSGVPAPGILIGAGVARGVIVTDEVVAGNPGIELIISAGETAAPSSDTGGALLLYGGAAYNGVGGAALLQGGTSLNGAGASATLAGGNSTNGPAGDVFVIGGQNGIGGGSVHLIMTTLGTSGALYIRNNSTILYEITADGTLYVNGQGGNAGQFLTSNGAGAFPTWTDGGAGTWVGAALSGGTTTNPTATLNYSTIGKQVTVWSTVDLTATSNASTDIIISTLPSALRPSVDRYVTCHQLENGTAPGYSGVAKISTTGAITISLLQTFNSNTRVGVNAGNGWITSGVKGIQAGWVITYTR